MVDSGRVTNCKVLCVALVEGSLEVKQGTASVKNLKCWFVDMDGLYAVHLVSVVRVVVKMVLNMMVSSVTLGWF